jgi:WD40 repeat protein
MTLPGGPHNQFGIVGPMVLSPDGSTIAVGAEQSIFLCDIQHLTLINTIRIAQKNESLAFSPDGSLLAGCTWEFNQTDIPTGRVLPPQCKTSVWRVSDAKLIFAQHQQHYLMSSVFFSQDGKSLVTLSYDPCVADIFNLSSGAFEKSVNLVNNPVTFCMPESDQLPKLCYTSRGNGQYNQSSLSQDQRLLATSVNGDLAIFDTTRSPALPILRIVFFPTQRPDPLYDQHGQAVALPSPDQLAKSIAWFIDMPDPKDNHLQYWDGSSTSQRYVAWNLCATGVPGPTEAEINRRRRPDLILNSLKGNAKPAEQTALR